MACGFCEKVDGLRKISIKPKTSKSFSAKPPPSYVHMPQYSAPGAVSPPATIEIYQCQMCDEYCKKDGTRLGYDLDRIKKDLGE
jgi:hypothetical protein